MIDLPLHPTPDRLEDYVADVLPAADRAPLASHLLGCDRCRSEVDELRGLFATLAGLPRLEPSANFADHVLARLQLTRPLPLRVEAWLRALFPRSTLGLGVASALLGLPVAIALATFLWLADRTGVTLQSLLTYGQIRLGQLIPALFDALVSMLLKNELVLGAFAALQALGSAGGPVPLALLAMFTGLLSVVSAWILYTNLIHTRTREPLYARLRP